jgi:rhamnogalacturonyl hydrolase YesR
VLPAFRPNAIATVFAGQALLDTAETTGDQEAADMAASAGRFIVTRLRRSIDTAADLCFSYTPWDQTRIYNSSALVAAFLTRLGRSSGDLEYLELGRRAMHYLVKEQRPDGCWFYGAGRVQRWIDSFHTGYNLEAMLAYRQLTGDNSVDDAVRRGYSFYVDRLFDDRGVPKYFYDALYPIDVHCCSQAILTFTAFAAENPEAWRKALEVTQWTLNNMRAPAGHFIYQIHRWWRDETPYMRWAQAWMFRALARLQRSLTGEYAASGIGAESNPSERAKYSINSLS